MLALGNNITLTFDQAVEKGTGTIGIYKSADNTLLETAYDVASSGLVTGWGTNKLTINPSIDLAASTGYYVKVTSTAVKSAGGASFVGINDATTLNFTTAAADGSVAPTVYTGPVGSFFGYSVSSAGDVNGDGYGDFIVGTDSSTGGAYVVYGDASGLGLSMTGGTIAASKGFKISGGNYLGNWVSGIGDVNGDGLDDVIVGSYSTIGAAYVVYGNTSGTGLTLDGSNNITNSSSGYKIAGKNGSYLGSSVSGAGDVNGDGLADFIVGAFNQSGSGNAFVVYGKAGNTHTGLNLSNLTISASDGFQIIGATNSGLGASVSGAGDVNGDGLSDVIVTGTDKNVYVVYGNSTGATVDLGGGAIANTRGFKISTTLATSGFGSVASSAGDVNGDGLADVIVGSYGNNSAYVIYGNASGASATINSAGAIAAASGFRIASAKIMDFGNWVSSAGDVNGDGLGDFIIGTTYNSVGAYVVYGNATGATVNIDSNGVIAAANGFRISGPASGLYGYRVSGAGDINGDGLADLLVGSNAAGYSLVLGGTQWQTAAVSGSGTVTGTASAEAVIGSAAADTLTGGGGVDRFYAGVGNDTVVLTASDVTNLANNTAGGPKALMNGGGGFDTIRMSGGAALDLTTITHAGAMGLEENSRIESIERIDLATDTAVNTLTLMGRDVKDMAGFNLIRTGSVSADGNTWTNVTGSTRASGLLTFETAPAGISRVWTGPSDWALADGSNSGDADLEDVIYSAANSGRYRNLDYTAIAAGTAVTSISAGFNFAMNTVGSQSGDGLNFSFGDKSSLGNFEQGYSRGLSIEYGGLNVFAPDQKLRIYWNGTQIGVSTADITLNAKHTTNVSVSDTGVVTVLVDGSSFATATISGWQTANKAGWMFGYGGRTGQATGSAWVDDMTATANTQALGSTTSAHQLVVDGSSNDTVVLSPDLGDWINAGTVSNGSSNYTVYAQSLGGNSQVLVRSGVNVTNNDPVPFTGGNVTSNGISMTLANSFVENGKTYWIVTGYSGVFPTHLASGANAQHDVLDRIFNNSQDTTNDARSFFSGGYTFILPTSQELIDLVLSPFPAGLFNGLYWSSTLSSANSHELVQIFHNTSQAAVDSSTNAPVIVQVLPVVIDLNRDGELRYGQVTMDVNGDGLLDVTKWAGAQDGVLVWDKFADGLVHDNSQYAFAQYATTYRMDALGQARSATDLEGLADAFDSNRDGVFDAQDAQFAEFKVWQDANQNGVSDAGEVRSLVDWGISSINLLSDGVVRAPAEGVVEAGQTLAMAADGTSVLVADAAFAYSAMDYRIGGGELSLQGSQMKLHLSSLVSQHGAIDHVDLNGSGANTLQISLQDVLLGSASGRLRVTGNADDTVQLDANAWTNSGRVVFENGHRYAVFNANQDVAAQLLLDKQLLCHVL
jgi:hypothetical protein